MAFTMKAQVIEVLLDADLPKKSGGTYKASVLKYKDLKFGQEKSAIFFSKQLKDSPELEAALKGLTAGSEVSLGIEKDGKFNRVTSINGAGKPITSVTTDVNRASKVSTFKDNTAGMIKGNTVSNAVALAIKNAGSLPVTLTSLIEASELVLDLHAHLETQDILDRVTKSNKDNEVI